MRLSAVGPASPEDVWTRYVDPALWSSWAPHIRQVDCPDPALRPGSTGVVHGPWPVRVSFRILSLDDVDRRWTWQVLGFTMTHGVDATPVGSRAWVELLAPAAIPYAPVAQRALQRLTS